MPMAEIRIKEIKELGVIVSVSTIMVRTLTDLEWISSMVVAHS